MNQIIQSLYNFFTPQKINPPNQQAEEEEQEEDPNSTVSTEQRQLALIIGQNNYQFLDKLFLSIKDAEIMEKTLKNIGFSTTLLIDRKNNELKKDFIEFSSKLEEGDIVFFYYSGHATQQTINNRTDNFLFGIDAQQRSEEGVKITEGIALHQKIFSKWLNEICIYLIVIDACRVFPQPDEKFKAGFAASGANQGYVSSAMTLAPTCLPHEIKRREYDVVYACQPGYGALEDEQMELGYLAKALSTALSKPGTWSEALVETINQVQQDTNYRQKPSVTLNVGKKLIIQPQDDISPEEQMPQKIDGPQIDGGSLKFSNVTTFLKSLENDGFVCNQFIQVENSENNIIISPNKKINNNVILLKGVKFVSLNPGIVCSFIIIEVNSEKKIQIEDCVFQGIGLQILNQQNKTWKFNCGEIFMNRVKFFGCPDTGLRICDLKSVQVENIELEKCLYGIVSFKNSEFDIQYCNISNCTEGVNIVDTDYFILHRLDLQDCELHAFHFNRSRGEVTDCRYRKCNEGICQGRNNQILISNVIKV